MKTGKLLEQIVYTDGENKITLSRTMTAEYNIVDGEIEIEWAGGDGDDYEFEGPRAEELEDIYLNDDNFEESETWYNLGFEEGDQTLQEVA
jgi:hypothetical protein